MLKNSTQLITIPLIQRATTLKIPAHIYMNLMKLSKVGYAFYLNNISQDIL